MNDPVVRALLLTVRLPVCGPAFTGAKAINAVQLAPGPSVVTQVVLTNWNPAVTASDRLVRLFTLSGLVRVTVLLPLVWPTPVCRKVSRLGWKLTEPGTPPLPLSATLAEDASEEDEIVSAPV